MQSLVSNESITVIHLSYSSRGSIFTVLGRSVLVETLSVIDRIKIAEEESEKG